MAPCIFVLLLSWQCIGRRCGTLWPVTSNILLIQYLPILDKSCWSKLHETHVVSPCFTYKYAWKSAKTCTDCSTKSPYSKRIVRARCAARFGPWRCSSRLQPLLDRFEELLRLQHKALWRPSTFLNFTQLVPTGSNCYWNCTTICINMSQPYPNLHLGNPCCIAWRGDWTTCSSYFNRD